MRHLLDTSAWFRAVTAPETLPQTIRELIGQAEEDYGLAAISLWEIGKKVQMGKLGLGMPLREWFAAALPANIVVLPLDERIVAQTMELRGFPNRDPADEMIVATAMVHGLTLVTSDSKLKAYRHAQIRCFKPML